MGKPDGKTVFITGGNSNLAVAAGASYLDLANPSNVEGERLRQKSGQLRVVDPTTFLLELAKTGSGHLLTEERFKCLRVGSS